MSKKRGVGDEAVVPIAPHELSRRCVSTSRKDMGLRDRGAIDDLKAHHYIDDYEYAYFLGIAPEKLRGGMSKRELSRKGVDITLQKMLWRSDYKYKRA